MELFVRYDLERLAKYATLPQNTSRIRIYVTTNYACLHFADVSYFNYCICLDIQQIRQIVEETKRFYQATPHRLLVEDTVQQADIHLFLKQQGYCSKGRQVVLVAPDQFSKLNVTEVVTDLERVSVVNLHPFTQDYLTAFESNRTDAEPVAINFGQLLRSSDILLYRVLADQRPVGIAALYQQNKHFLLAGGATLPLYRNQGFHTGALINRLRYCYQHQPASISAWAYEGSVSYQNMCRLGLVPHKRYWIYEHGI
ncbi:hypothetical protein [Spirosoma foliorum]|uniref:N-acetyltransferase domain-containing protein n=1 Tax=Spirosoma foliorum TaxID=2710596 RepID=A0A7G5H1M6_9BACT|nr:hypothetical protein [Spirosoma foliorum]QMW05018.1 hypothetical protein H3H32_09055 [Spirosoma foliorum]